MKIARGCTFVLNNFNYSYLNAPLPYSTTLNSFYAVFFLYCLLIITVQLYFVNVYCTYLLTEWLYTQWVSHGRMRNHLNSNKQHSEDAHVQTENCVFLLLVCSGDLKRSHFLAELHKAFLFAWLKTVTNRDDRTWVLWRQQSMWPCGSGKFAAKCLDGKKKRMGQSQRSFLEVMTYVSSCTFNFAFLLVPLQWMFRAKRMWVRFCLTRSWSISLLFFLFFF